MPRAFRFGLMAESVRTRDDLIATAKRAEELGYDTLLIRDHFVEEPFGHQLAPIAALATVAAVTTSLRIGTLVFAVDYRHPVILAKEAATLDLLSGGRFELGIGAGFSRAEYDAAGMPFAANAVRVDRLEEALQVLKALFSGRPVTFAGRHYRLNGLDAFPVPVQQPRPSLLVGAGGRRMLTIAAREADTVAVLSVDTTRGAVSDDPTPRLAASVERQVCWIREAAGDRFAQLELSLFGRFTVTDQPHRAAERLAQERGWSGLSVDDVLAMPGQFFGTEDAIADLLHARRERYGVSYYVVSDDEMHQAAPIVSAMAGG